MDNAALFFFIFSLSNQNPILDQLMIFAAQYLIYLTFLLILIFTFTGGIKERKALLLILVSLPIVVILIKFVHLFLNVERPFVEYGISSLISHQSDASFPSRHGAFMFTIAFSYLFYRSKWATLFLLLASFVGLSRIYVGVHYPLDILGGIGFGFAAVWISKIILRLFQI